MPLEIIGAGLGRTGTMSLKLAIEKLGLGPCYHMAELFADPSRVPAWRAAAAGRPDREAVFKGFPATPHNTACSFWRELAAAYPRAKVILTVRDGDKWFESTQETIFNEAMSERIRSSPLKPFFEKTVWKAFGDKIHDRAFMTAEFKRHNAEVQDALPKPRVLVYEVKQGWGPLCAFLGVPAPSTPFPHVNSREEMKAMLAATQAQGSAPADPNVMSEMARRRIQEMRNKL
jgi:hypothetical protein